MSSVAAASLGLRRLLAALLVFSAALFIVGVAREHAAHRAEAKPAAAATEPAHTEGGDSDNHAGEGTVSASHVETHAETSSEGRVLGVDTEAWPFAIAFALASLGLAVGVLRTRSRVVVAVVGLVAGVAAVFDVAEIVHQVNDSQTLLVAIATAVTTLHLALAALAVLTLKAESPQGSADPAALVQAS